MVKTPRSAVDGRHGQVEFLLPNGNIYGVRPASPLEVRMYDWLRTSVARYERAEKFGEQAAQEVDDLRARVAALQANLEAMRIEKQTPAERLAEVDREARGNKPFRTPSYAEEQAEATAEIQKGADE